MYHSDFFNPPIAHNFIVKFSPTKLDIIPDYEIVEFIIHYYKQS